MKKKQLTTLISVCGAVLLFLVLIGKSLTVNYIQHEQYHRAMIQQLQADATITQSILKSRYSLLTSYDPIVKGVDEQQTLQQQLGQPPFFVDGRGLRTIQTLLSENASVQQQRQELIEQFKSQNAVLKNSLNYLPELVRDLKQGGIANAGSLLREMLDNILLYSLSSEQELVPKIQAQLTQIER